MKTRIVWCLCTLHATYAHICTDSISAVISDDDRKSERPAVFNLNADIRNWGNLFQDHYNTWPDVNIPTPLLFLGRFFGLYPTLMKCSNIITVVNLRYYVTTSYWRSACLFSYQEFEEGLISVWPLCSVNSLVQERLSVDEECGSNSASCFLMVWCIANVSHWQACIHESLVICSELEVWCEFGKKKRTISMAKSSVDDERAPAKLEAGCLLNHNAFLKNYRSCD